MPKKVGSITLEYDRGDGVIESQAFDSEFQNAIVMGDISAMEGTFTGRLSADSIDVLGNLQLAGGSVAVTQIDQRASFGVADGAALDFQYKNVALTVVEVPEGMSGAWCACAVQFFVPDIEGNQFRVNWRFLFDGTTYYTNAIAGLPLGWNMVEFLVYVSGSGSHTLIWQVQWGRYWTGIEDPPTFGPLIQNITMRTDMIRK